MVAIVLAQPTLLNPAAAPGADLLRLLFVGGRSFGDDLPGEVREYGAGTLRLVTAGTRRRGAGTTYSVTAEQLALVRAWQGLPLLYRDGLGTRLWVSYLSCPVEPSDDAARFLVALDLQEVTVAETV